MTVFAPLRSPGGATSAAAALAVALAGCSGEARPIGPGLPLTPPAGPADRRIASYDTRAFQIGQGGRYFAWYGCQACHAPGGSGGSLGRLPRRHGDGFDAVYASIASGHPAGLQIGAERIPAEQLWQITAYVRSLPTLDVEKRRRQDLDTVAEAQASRAPRPQR